jgi:hypothetical protein
MASTTKGTALQSYTDLERLRWVPLAGRSLNSVCLKTDSLAGHLGFEPTNPSASYPWKSHWFIAPVVSPLAGAAHGEPVVRARAAARP